jgi:hypothetical protein
MYVHVAQNSSKRRKKLSLEGIYSLVAPGLSIKHLGITVHAHFNKHEVYMNFHEECAIKIQ